jgi:hypothetical protein
VNGSSTTQSPWRCGKEPRRNRKKLTFGYDEVVGLGEAGGDAEVNW